MNREEVWKNFDLGTELEVAGTFLYNGMRCFQYMHTLNHTDEIFEFLYNVSVGMERLLKVAVVLLEHEDGLDQATFEDSLITHNHLELLSRVRAKATINVANPHHDFLALLTAFYKTFRYDRFNASVQWDPDKERAALRSFFERHLSISLEDPDSLFVTHNTSQIRKFAANIIGKIARELYETSVEQARNLNLYTYERRSGSKASKVFLVGDWSFQKERVVQKELLIWFMNTGEGSPLLEHLRSIEPLDLDPALAPDYVQCLLLGLDVEQVLGEMDELYTEIQDPGTRLEELEPIDDPMVGWEGWPEDDEHEF